MKYFLCLLLFVFLSCGEKKTSSYRSIHNECQQDYEEKKQTATSYFLADPSCIVGATLPEFNALSFDGNRITHKSLKGKVSILNFWYQACPPCIAEIPGLDDLVDEYGKDKVNFIAISKDTDASVEKFIRTTEWDFVHLTAGKNIIEEDFQLFWGYPTTFVCDKNGVIIEAFSGGATDSNASFIIKEKLKSVINKYL